MAFLKKVHPNWYPSENEHLQVGETLDFNAPFDDLVKRGMAILVDENGNELELPNQNLTCPICFTNITGLLKFVAHVETHAPKKIEVSVPEAITEMEPGERKEEAVADTKATDTYNKRLAALAKARAARKAKK